MRRRGMINTLAAVVMTVGAAMLYAPDAQAQVKPGDGQQFCCQGPTCSCCGKSGALCTAQGCSCT